MKSKILLGLMVLICSACAETKIKSVKDSSESQRVYSKILVSFDGNINEKSKAEESIIKKFKQYTPTIFYSEYQLFSPLNEYLQKDITKKLKEEGIQAIIFARLSDQKVEQKTGYMPVYTSTYGNVGGHNVKLNTTSVQTYQSDLATWLYRIEIFDLEKNKPVWIADAETQGYDRDYMRDSLVIKTVNEIEKSGFLLPK